MKVCFIGTGILNAFEGNVVGGAEKQQALMINGLRSRGVEIIVLEYYIKEKKEIEGVKFYPAWNKENKTFFKKLNNITNQIKEHNIKVIYARGTQIYIAFLFLLFSIKKLKIKLLWGIAGDHDLTSKYNYLRVKFASSLYAKLNAGIIFNISSRLLFYFSDTIICQTQEQIKRCKVISKDKSVIQISNIYYNDLYSKKPSAENLTNFDAIWIGKFSGIKGEEILLRIAQDIPDIKILCLGNVTKEYEKTVTYKRIKEQKNLILLGRVPMEEVSMYISKADFILNTSPSEGLSNVFLEGWDQNKPVISYIVNPNQYLSIGEAGFCAQNSYSKLILKLKSILKDKEFMIYHGEKGKNILAKNHFSQIIIPKYYNLFIENENLTTDI